jgi:GT2 family glycosyltransferase
MFSFIIINYNTAKLTRACLESIFKYCQASEFEIILVDNNSKIEDINILKDVFGDRIKVIINNKNLGFAKANNQGAKIAKGEYSFFLNSDTFITQDILSPIEEFFKKNNEVGVIAPRLILKAGEDQSYAFAHKKNSKDLAWVSGAALVIRQDIFNKIGGWDERFFMYFEDVDLCRSVVKNNFKISRLESITVTHLLNGSPIFYFRRKIYYYRSKILFILKHYFKLL